MTDVPIDVSGTMLDVSGTMLDVSGTMLDVSGTMLDVSGSILDVSSYTFQSAPPVPTVIRLDDILSQTTVLLQKEATDAAALAAIGNPDINELRTRLVAWAVTGFAGSVRACEVYISPPAVCSDGAARDLSDYIQFVSGKSIYDHLALLSEKLPDFRVAFVYMGDAIHFMVSKV